MFYVYIIRSVDLTHSIYVGFATDLAARLLDHNGGKCVFTKKHRPWKIVYSEQLETKSLALMRERQIKKWSRAKKEALIRGDLVKLKSLSKRRS